MKRHAEQISRDAARESHLNRRGIIRVQAPFAFCDLREPGDFVAIIAAKGPVGEQHTYMVRCNRDEMEAAGIREMDQLREIMPNCHLKEEEQHKRRSSFIKYLSEHVAAALLDHLERNDPKFGYTQEQWEEMNRP